MSYSVSDPIKFHVDGSRFYFFPVPFTMLFSAILSVSAGVGGCEWPISDRAIFTAVDFWKFSNNPPNYASMADAITFLIMLHATCNGSFWGAVDCIGVLDFSPRKKYPSDLLHASGSEK